MVYLEATMDEVGQVPKLITVEDLPEEIKYHLMPEIGSPLLGSTFDEIRVHTENGETLYSISYRLVAENNSSPLISNLEDLKVQVVIPMKSVGENGLEDVPIMLQTPTTILSTVVTVGGHYNRYGRVFKPEITFDDEGPHLNIARLSTDRDLISFMHEYAHILQPEGLLKAIYCGHDAKLMYPLSYAAEVDAWEKTYVGLDVLGVHYDTDILRTIIEYKLNTYILEWKARGFSDAQIDAFPKSIADAMRLLYQN